MSEIDPEDVFRPPHGSVLINGETATSIAYTQHDGALDLTFLRGDTVVEQVDGVRDPMARIALIGLQNSMRINRGDATGTLEGSTLRHHATTRLPDGRAVSASSPAQDWLLPDAAEEPAPETTTPEPNAAEVEEASPNADAAEQRRRSAVLASVRGQFRVEGDAYRFKDGRRALAFTDRGSRIATASNDDRAARAVAAMADAKGWGAIKVTGHADFRREVWLEAEARGITVRGYKPTEQDQEALAKRTAERLTNTVERADSRGREETNERGAARKGSRSTARASKASRGPTTHAGTLIERGAAPYRHDPTASASYFATLDTADGERVAWGKDIERAIDESGAQPGDPVTLVNVGREPVTVTEPVRDASGAVVGEREVRTHLNRWEAKGPAQAASVTGDEGVRDRALEAIAREKTRTPDAAHALHARLRTLHAERAVPIPVAFYDPAARSAALRRGTPVKDASAGADRAATTERDAEADAAL